MVDLIQSIGPPSFGRSAELFGVAQKVLSQSGLKSGNKMVVLTDTRTHKEIVDAFFGAGLSLEADTVVLMSKPMKSLGDPNEWGRYVLMKSSTCCRWSGGSNRERNRC